jgi:aminoglycoside 3-N-acetyltransferase
MITTKEIASDLRALGLVEGMNLVVHSSLSSLGKVEGGADAVVDALLEALGKSGTLAMPAFYFPPPELFDPAVTPSRMGAITEAFRKRPGVLRSFHPTHSVAATGPLAAHFVEAHKTATAFGIDSPLHRLAKSGGHVLLLGVQHTSDSMVHIGEAVARVPYRKIAYSKDFEVDMPVRLPDGSIGLFPPKENPGCSLNFNVVDAPLRERGSVRTGKVGEADCQLVPAQDVIDVVCEMLAQDMAALLCDVDCCPFCPRARALVEAEKYG